VDVLIFHITQICIIFVEYEYSNYNVALGMVQLNKSRSSIFDKDTIKKMEK